MWEAMIAELRAVHVDYDVRRHFTAEKTPILDTRTQIADALAPALALGEVPARSATSLQLADHTGLVELG